jgi:hypothetical protein
MAVPVPGSNHSTVRLREVGIADKSTVNAPPEGA